MFEANRMREINIEECEFVGGGGDLFNGKSLVKDERIDDDGGEPIDSSGEGGGIGQSYFAPETGFFERLGYAADNPFTTTGYMVDQVINQAIKSGDY
jgi:hypothetical protein